MLGSSLIIISTRELLATAKSLECIGIAVSQGERKGGRVKRVRDSNNSISSSQ